MPSIVDVLTLSTLVVLAVEVILLRRDLGKRDYRPRSEREPGEAQVINVNLGTAPQPGASSGASGTPLSIDRASEDGADSGPVENGVPAPEEGDSEHAEPRSEPPRRMAPAPRQAANGLAVLTCKNCKSENSAYRTECFNCGEPLR